MVICTVFCRSAFSLNNPGKISDGYTAPPTIFCEKWETKFNSTADAYQNFWKPCIRCNWTLFCAVLIYELSHRRSVPRAFLIAFLRRLATVENVTNSKWSCKVVEIFCGTVVFFQKSHNLSRSLLTNNNFYCEMPWSSTFISTV